MRKRDRQEGRSGESERGKIESRGRDAGRQRERAAGSRVSE